MSQSNKSRPHKITGLPSCWFHFAGIVNRAEALCSASLLTLALCTKTIYQDYNNIWKCLCIPFMQLVTNLTSGSLPTYELKLRGALALVHVETIGQGTDLYRGLQTFFCKDRKREILYIYIYDICSFLTFTTWAGWQSSYFLNSQLPSPTATTLFFSNITLLLPVWIKRHTCHRHLQRSIRIPRRTCRKKKLTVGLKKKSVCFWWKVLILKNMCRLSHVQCIG